MTLKTYITNLGFFELALAAPSMKAALEAWGMGHNAFHQGFAKQTQDAAIVAATMAKPGVVLRRPVGSKGVFREDAELPKDLWKLTPSKPAAKPKTAPAPVKAAKTKHVANKVADRAAILSFEKAKARRDQDRAQAQARDEARRKKEQVQSARQAARADAELERARARHDEIVAAIRKDQDRIDRRAAAEEARWDAQRAKLDIMRTKGSS